MLAALRFIQMLFNMLPGMPESIYLGARKDSQDVLSVEVYWKDHKIRMGVTRSVMQNDEQWSVETLLSNIKVMYEQRSQ